MGPITDLYQAIWYGGLLMAVLIVLFGSFKGIWVWGSAHRQVEDERDYWRDAFFRLAKLSDVILPDPETERRRR